MDCAEHRIERKAKAIGGRHRIDLRLRRRAVDLIHAVRRDRQQHRIAAIQKCLAQHVDRLIHTVGQQHLRRRNIESGGNNRFHRSALRIARQIGSGDLAQSLDHARRASQRVLVEIQPQPIAPGNRRMILLHAAHALARSGASFRPAPAGALQQAHARPEPPASARLIRRSTAAACPLSPSALASVTAAWPSARTPSAV